ncbi:MAG: type II toxin-antitoxin system PemK/MazF family toxin [Syntrophobacteraceae bacterium]
MASKRDYFPRRGDVITLDFDPVKGHEQGGRRPAVVISEGEIENKLGPLIFP